LRFSHYITLHNYHLFLLLLSVFYFIWWFFIYPLDKYIFTLYFTFFSFNKFNIIWYLLFPTQTHQNDSRPKDLKRTYDQKIDLEISTRSMILRRVEKDTYKPLCELHYDCRPLREQLYPREIHFIKLRWWSPLNTIEEAWGELFYWLIRYQY